MTPICKTANHQCDRKTSVVYHGEIPGKAVAKFMADDHVTDAQEFIDICSAKYLLMSDRRPIEYLLHMVRTCDSATLDRIEAAILTRKSEDVTPYDGYTMDGGDVA